MNKTIYVNFLILKIWQILKRISPSHFIKQKLFLLLKCAYCQLCKKNLKVTKNVQSPYLCVLYRILHRGPRLVLLGFLAGAFLLICLTKSKKI